MRSAAFFGAASSAFFAGACCHRLAEAWISPDSTASVRVACSLHWSTPSRCSIRAAAFSCTMTAISRLSPPRQYRYSRACRARSFGCHSVLSAQLSCSQKVRAAGPSGSSASAEQSSASSSAFGSTRSAGCFSQKSLTSFSALAFSASDTPSSSNSEACPTCLLSLRIVLFDFRRLSMPISEARSDASCARASMMPVTVFQMLSSSGIGGRQVLQRYQSHWRQSMTCSPFITLRLQPSQTPACASQGRSKWAAGQ
mmetsp:Transcript_57543/g.147994  ORF Transcript_57543/g.147994 Transcript_57543/m.147994 type:complete len:255 (-) Transcript_57543:121-885(-)